MIEVSFNSLAYFTVVDKYMGDWYNKRFQLLYIIAGKSEVFSMESLKKIFLDSKLSEVHFISKTFQACNGIKHHLHHGENLTAEP